MHVLNYVIGSQNCIYCKMMVIRTVSLRLTNTRKSSALDQKYSYI